MLVVNSFFFLPSTGKAVFRTTFTILSKATEQHLHGDIFNYIFIRKRRIIDKFPSFIDLAKDTYVSAGRRISQQMPWWRKIEFASSQLHGSVQSVG